MIAWLISGRDNLSVLGTVDHFEGHLVEIHNIGFTLMSLGIKQ